MERLKLYYQSLKQSVLAVLVNSTILLGLLWNDIERSHLLGWYSFALIVTIYRIIVWWQFNRIEKSRYEERQWYLHMLIGSILSGLIWGGAGYFLFSDNIFYQALLAFIIAGMSAGGIINLSSFLESSLSFLVLVILPFLIRLLQEGSTEALQMGFMVFLYLLLISVSARRVHQTVLNGLTMKFMYQRAESKIKEQALYDELTQLPNRRLLKDRMLHALARAQRSNIKGALLFLDLDNFKRINDTLGHIFGDGLLQQVATRLNQHIRTGDTAARLGGDEFVVLLTDLSGSSAEIAQNVQLIADKIRQALEVPFKVQNHELHVTSSIGVSLFPDDSHSVDDLLKHADTAMYQAKNLGKNAVHFFLKDMQDSLNKRLELEKALHKAIKNEEFRLYFQPLVELNGTIFGGEALIRWFKDDEQMVPPDEFIPIAEETGLIYLIGDWVLNQTCHCMSEISKLNLPNDFKYLSMNVSPQEFNQKDFAIRIEQALKKNALSGRYLEIEVTENLLLDDVSGTVQKMEKLREMGISFSIDDFGTGYSSLAYLKKLPVDSLKIDRSFVQDVLSDNNDATIVKTILSMSHMLGLKVIAEGVENKDTWRFLEQHGCQFFQGYLIGKPMPFEEFMIKLKNGSVFEP
ncbi:MAG: EAL domain-containing protein [Gammaproteobacteria bacterium]|nr:EAL domain-containing protein [Gammaproteobacteria bacterium]